MKKERLLMSIQTVKENIEILETEEPEDAGYLLQLEHEKHVLELLEAEAEGRIVTLPCKVGEMVWMIVTRPAGSYIRRGRLTRKNLFRVVRDLGKTLFLTREEAEKALEGMK